MYGTKQTIKTHDWKLSFKCFTLSEFLSLPVLCSFHLVSEFLTVSHNITSTNKHRDTLLSYDVVPCLYNQITTESSFKNNLKYHNHIYKILMDIKNKFKKIREGPMSHHVYIDSQRHCLLVTSLITYPSPICFNFF